MKKYIIVALLLVSCSAFSQNYQPTWASIDERPVPQWWQNDKFGIFIHWGVYSVPSWAPTGDSISVYYKYAEWYWNRLIEKSPVQKYFQQFHLKNYGPDFQYQDFAPEFKAKLFNPEQWAELFKNSGAKYVVLTSKHHEGFTLWPSAQSWNWNSVDVGPHRDLCGDLSAAVKKEGLHMGFYYSLYEWYNPLYKNEFTNYVDEHMLPQMKDLVTSYKPDILWTDGEWEKTSQQWKSAQFLAWLYNESPVKENVVVNDRWGSETRGKHGGFYTTEYGLVDDKEADGGSMAHPWEECRGIGTSFGYNRAENLDSYSSSKQLINILISTVSAGGNLLLDIGPTADGIIPVIMQQRLLDMGKWLGVNGEAIYGTRRFITRKADLSINPETNKTVFFTRKNNDLYVLCTEWPEENIVLKGLGNLKNADVTLLGIDKPVSVKRQNGNMIIVLPQLSPDNYELAYVFKISGIAGK